MMMTTVLESLNSWLKRAMADDEQVLVMGEDILDPYGGAFKVTRGLSDSFTDRVITTPISEAGIVGIATGMALRGYKPVVEIMFGDFSALIVDQVVNHLSKFSTLYTDGKPLQMVIRTPMGGRRGYGPTHSQSLERLFLGMPSIKVVAPVHIPGGAGELLYHAILTQEEPVFFVENKLQYLLEIMEDGSNAEIDVGVHSSGSADGSEFKQYMLRVRGAPAAEFTIMAYGYMVELAVQAMLELAYNEEIFINIYVFTQISPLLIPCDFDDIARQQHGILILEEGSLGWGWGAEVSAQLSERYWKKPIRVSRLASKEQIIPASMQLESKILPQVDDIIQSIKRLRGGK